MAFSPEFLDEIRARVGLANLIGRRVKLTKKGREHSGLCPFHKEKTPSFTVNEGKGFYHCFGCQEHGSIFDFIMKLDGLSFPEAVERLAGEAGLQMPVDSPEERERAIRRQTLVDVMEAATAHFEKALRMPEGRGALAYLKGRGLSDETIERFRLGFASGARGALKGALAGAGISEDLMVEGGLLIRPDDAAREPYDRFRGRVMFPITNRRGQPVAFGARVLEGQEAGRPAGPAGSQQQEARRPAGPAGSQQQAEAGTPAAPAGAQQNVAKYLNSPETPLFHKGRMLYGLAQAAGPARKEGVLVVCEGYMDVIALHQAGIEGAVAPLGTAVTEEQIAELWRYAPEPVLCFDGDEAGRRAAGRAAERALALLKPGFGMRFALLPQGEDPDSLVKAQGAAAFRQLLEGALPLSEVIWRLETGGRAAQTPEARAALQTRLDGHVRRIADATVRAHFASAFKDRLWRGPAGPGGARKWATAPSLGAGTVARAGADPALRQEQVLLAVLLAHPGLYDRVGERLGSVAFLAPDLDKLRQEALKTLGAEPGLDTEGIKHQLEEQGYAEILGSILSPQVFEHALFAGPDADPEQVIDGWEETFARYRRKDLQAERRELKQDLVRDRTPEAFEKFRALKLQEQETRGDDPDL